MRAFAALLAALATALSLAAQSASPAEATTDAGTAAGTDVATAAAADAEALPDPLAGVFDSPADVTASPAEPAPAPPVAKPDKIVISGNYSTDIIAAIGWKAFPDLADISIGFDRSVGFAPAATFVLDARPDDSFRAYGSLTVGLRPDLTPFPQLTLNELFCDFYFLDALYLRVGKQALSWGQGRMFTPANFVSDAVNQATARLSFPTVLEGLSFVAMAPPDIATNPTVPVYDLASIAGRVDCVAGPVLLGLGTFYKTPVGLKVSFSAKTTIGGVDFYAEAMGRYYNSLLMPSALLGAYWLASDNSFLVLGEYYWNGETVGGGDHTIGLRVGFNNIFGSSIDFGIDWQHAFLDSSGSLTLGIVAKPWDKLNVSIGVPIIYGAPGARYPTANADPSKRVLALVIKATIAGSF